jgi:hypothetical protein
MEGTYLYDGTVECDLRIVHSPVRYGSGDLEDPPEIENNVAVDTYYVWYGSTTARGVYNSGGGGYPSLADAVASVEAAADIGRTVRWCARKT